MPKTRKAILVNSRECMELFGKDVTQGLKPRGKLTPGGPEYYYYSDAKEAASERH